MGKETYGYSRLLVVLVKVDDPAQLVTAVKFTNA